MRRSLALLGPLAVLTCTACVPQGLAFRVDQRVQVVSPEDEATVSLPLTLRWTVRDFEVVAPGSPVRDGAGYFAVFVDATPMRPGKTLESLREADAVCEDPCDDDSYFPARGIYPTAGTELVLEELPPASSDDEDHRATIVLLDGEGRRIGESSFHVDFTVPVPEEDS